MNRNQQHQLAWEALMFLNKRHYVTTGFYALGDAFLISKDPKHKNKIVLVEHCGKLQINHWEWTINKSECPQPTITTNGDDGNGNLKRKAPSLKVYS